VKSVISFSACLTMLKLLEDLAKEIKIRERERERERQRKLCRQKKKREREREREKERVKIKRNMWTLRSLTNTYLQKG